MLCDLGGQATRTERNLPRTRRSRSTYITAVDVDQPFRSISYASSMALLRLEFDQPSLGLKLEPLRLRQA
jgi:hypothetical protein